MSLRSLTGNENGQFTGHGFASVVIPAHAGIQGFSRDFAWIPVFTGMTDYNRYPASCYHFRTHTFEGGHEEPSAAEPQPNLGVSPAKTRRPQSSEFGNEVIRRATFFFLKLGDFAPWRENSRIRALSVSGSFAQATQIFNYSSTKGFL
jgi:hypothetical protein